MTTKKVYIAPKAEVFTVKQESPLMAGTVKTAVKDGTGGDNEINVQTGTWGQPSTNPAKQTSFSLWDENDEDNGGLWDE